VKIEEYLKIVVPKIGTNSAFDLLRDARAKALENLLIEKKVATKEEIEAETEKQMGETAHNIFKMPPLPVESKKKNNEHQ